jgi:hypothetical protein
MIKYQGKDKNIHKIENIYSQIIDFIKSNHDKQVLNSLFSEIDKLIFIRFGFKVKHIIETRNSYSVFAVTPLETHIFTENKNKYSEIKETVESEIQNCKKIKEKLNLQHNCINSITEIESFNDKNRASILYYIYNSHKVLKEKLENGFITIDSEKGFIFGLPDEFQSFLFVNIELLITKYNLNSKMLTAILLHEIGHLFTYLKYSHRSVRNSVFQEESLLSLVRETNHKDIFRITFNEKIYKEAKKSDITIAYRNINNEIINFFGNRSQNHLFVEAEAIADQFVTRFNYGFYLVEALQILNKKLNKTNKKRYIKSEQLSVLDYVNSPHLNYNKSSIFIKQLFGFIEKLRFGDYSRKALYDREYDRYSKIKNDLNQIIMTHSLSEEEQIDLVFQFEAINSILQKTEKSKSSIFDKLPHTRKELINKKLANTINELTSNDLHAMALKFELLAKK